MGVRAPMWRAGAHLLTGSRGAGRGNSRRDARVEMGDAFFYNCSSPASRRSG